MSESLWESEVAESVQPEESSADLVSEATAKPGTEPATEAASKASVLSLSVDEFSALEERILRAVNLVKQERRERAAAEKRAAAAEAQLREAAPQTERLQTEVNALRSEREAVRQRVERLLAQLDALEV
jgi:FtsZ-binding cell division protein ZapB